MEQYQSFTAKLRGTMTDTRSEAQEARGPCVHAYSVLLYNLLSHHHHDTEMSRGIGDIGQGDIKDVY